MPHFSAAQLGAMERFVDALRCPLCKLPVRDPVTTDCLHHFCAECIEDHLATHSECPKCHVPVLASGRRPNFVLHNIAQNIAELQAVVKAQRTFEADGGNKDAIDQAGVVALGGASDHPRPDEPSATGISEVSAAATATGNANLSCGEAAAVQTAAPTQIPILSSFDAPAPSTSSSLLRVNPPELAERPVSLEPLSGTRLQSTPEMPPPCASPTTPSSHEIEQWRRDEELRELIDAENLKTLDENINAASRRSTSLAAATATTTAAAASSSAAHLPARRLCIVPTTLSTMDQLADLKRVCQMLGAEFANDVQVGVTTHIVTAPRSNSGSSRCKPTFKYLWGVSQGCWIVCFEWIQACDRAQKRAPEEDYEIECEGSAVKGANLSTLFRLGRSANRPGLFAGLTCDVGLFSRNGSSILTREQTIELLSLNGARLVDMHKKHQGDQSPMFIIVGHPAVTDWDESSATCEFCCAMSAQFGDFPLVDSGWVMLSLLSHRVEPMEEWLLHGVDDGEI